MSFGMYATADEQLGSPPHAGADEADLGVCLEAHRHPEVVVLSQERSQEAALALQERHRSSRRFSRYGRLLRCQDAGGGGRGRASGGSGPAGAAPPSFKKSSPTLGASLRKKLFEVLPVLEWLPAITCRSARADIVAGLTVGVMVIPQSMSYASIAGLPYIYGMYAACMPVFVYALLGQSRQLAVGPVAMVSLLVQGGLSGQMNAENCPQWYSADPQSHTKPQNEVCEEAFVRLAILTAAVVGAFQLVARVMKLGFLVSFLGHPVTSGFTSAAAIIIGLSQLKYILGYDVEKSEFVHVTLGHIFRNIGKTQPMTLLLGIVWIAFLIVSKRLSQRRGWLAWLGPLGPLIGCIVGTLLILACAPLRDRFQVKYVGDIPAGIFPVSISSWNLREIPLVLPTAMSVTLIGYMESIAIGKNLAAKHGYEIDAGQELLALGAANFVGAMFSCYPVTGSFSRSAVSNATGAVSQLAGFVTAVVMLCTLMFLTPLFYYLPSFVLAAIVISSVIPLVAYNEAAKLWRIKKKDFCLWLAAFLGTLFLGVLRGIALAVLLSLVIVIYESVRPQIMILWRVPGTTIYRNVKQESRGAFIPHVFIARIGSSLYFANASFVKEMLLRYVEDLEEINTTQYIILEMTPVVSVDSTAVHVVEDIVNDFRGRGIQVAFAMVGNRVVKTFRKAKLTEIIGEQWFFPTVNEAVVWCLRHQEAKKRRQQQLEGMESIVEEDLSVQDNPVILGTEIGFSNDLHHQCTTVTLNLQKDIPMIMSEITAVFRRSNVTVSRAHVESLGDKPNIGAKHVYFVRSILHPGKLSEEEVADLHAELGALLHGPWQEEEEQQEEQEEALPAPGRTLLGALRRMPLGERDGHRKSRPMEEPQQTSSSSVSAQGPGDV